MSIRHLILPAFLAAAFAAFAAVDSPAAGRRIEVLFVGAPTANHPGHDPVSRYRILKKGLGVAGINLTYSEDPAEAFFDEKLSQFDAVLLYGNWKQGGFMPPSQLKALLSFVEKGGGFVPVHCASACYGGSPEFVKLVGARFASHGAGVFRVENVKPDHPILKDLPGFAAWDETYVHSQHGEDREVLQVRDGEPWTWTRTQGKGRVFYTASGHDHRVWDLPEFHQLIRNGIFWAAGDQACQKLKDLDLPELEEETVSLPGYRERKEITKAQKPLPPEESMKLAQVPPGMKLSLFASEPDIVNPIHVAWDHRGRAFVMETIDYPNNLQEGNLGHDRITICEDTDNDGRADKFTRFAENLSIPTTMVFARGGVICTNGSQVIFLKDSNGDDNADLREVLFDGLNTGDTHAGISNFRYGLDGWIYATIGYAGLNTTTGGREHKFATGVFRFRPDASELEFLQHTTNNTWGLGFTEEFDIVGSTANGNPSFYLTFPAQDYQIAGIEQPRTPRGDENPMFFPSSLDLRQVDQFDRYTAGAGHALYTSRRFPANYHNRIAFVCGPTGKLVGEFEMNRKGGGFAAKQLPNNLYSSADAWSGPVFAEPGPDGAVWIADWYNIIIQHNPTPSKQSAGIDAQRGKGNAYVTPLRDKQHGRIYRVYPRNSDDDVNPNLDPADPNSLLAGLKHPNLFWRTHALRLIVENQLVDLAPQLTDLIAEGTRGSAEAIYILDQLGELKQELHVSALRSDSVPLQRAAIRLADPAQLKSAFVRDGTILAQGRALADILAGLAKGAADPEIGSAVYGVGKNREIEIFGDPVLGDAWHMAARRQIDSVISAAGKLEAPKTSPESRNLLPNPDFSENSPAGWGEIRYYQGARGDSVRVSTSSDGREGNCLQISSDKVSDCGAANLVAVSPGTRYRLSGWIRTKDLKPVNGPGALLNIHGGPRTKGVKGTKGWTMVSVEFDSGKRREVLVHCLFGGYGGATGTAWYDDVSLVAIEKSRTLAGALSSLSEFRSAAGQPKKVIERKHKPDPAVQARGEAIYNRTCIACHGVHGKGVPLAFPPLDGSDWLGEDPELSIRIVLHGLAGPVTVNGKEFNNVMAPLGPLLNDRDIADVLTFVRQNWSNDLPAVNPGAVKKIREGTTGRVQMWTAQELGR